jgi:hypothetical protein
MEGTADIAGVGLDRCVAKDSQKTANDERRKMMQAWSGISIPSPPVEKSSAGPLKKWPKSKIGGQDGSARFLETL